MKIALQLLLSFVFYIFGFISILILGGLYILLTILIPPKYLQWYIRPGCRIILLCAGQWLKIEGQAPDLKKGPYLYLINHESMFDMFMMGAAIPEYFGILVAEYHFRIPFWKWIAKRYGGIPIERKNLAEAKKSLLQAENVIKQLKRSVAMFPEGTRTKDGKLQQFKKGPFHLAKNTGVTLIPCGIDGAFEAQNKVSWLLNPGLLTWRWGEPIPLKTHITAGYGHLTVEEIADWVRTQVGLLTGEFEPYAEF